MLLKVADREVFASPSYDPVKVDGARPSLREVVHVAEDGNDTVDFCSCTTFCPIKCEKPKSASLWKDPDCRQCCCCC